MLFEGLYGQTEIKKILTDMIEGDRVGHAFVFCGPDGIGRKSFAKAFAGALMCAGRKTGSAQPCGSCTGCILMQNGTNPDFVLIQEEDGKATLGVETVRRMQESLATAPEYGTKKVYVIDHAERLTVQAQNALLKTIEEPPEYAVVILICSNISLLIDTVRSRVVRLDFSRNRDGEVLEALRAHCGVVPEHDAEMICAYADGIIGRALVNPENFDTFRQLRERVLTVLEMLPGAKSEFLLEMSALFEKNQAYKEFLFFSINSFLRDMMLADRFGDRIRLQNVQFKDKIQRLAGRLGYHKADACVNIVQEAWTCLGRNVNYKLTIDSMAIRLQEAVK